MNYLAHIYLSAEDDEIKIGNFIADSVKGKKFISFPKQIQKGIILHRAIDTYTDVHPTFRESSNRLFNTYRHYSPVIIDIFYDHFLACNWSQFSTIPLNIYVEDFYTLLRRNYDILPKRVQNFLPYMEKDNWLYNYATLEGIGKILFQMNRRTANKSKMDLAINDLKINYTQFEQEFFIFFPDVKRFTDEKIKQL